MVLDYERLYRSVAGRPAGRAGDRTGAMRHRMTIMVESDYAGSRRRGGLTPRARRRRAPDPRPPAPASRHGMGASAGRVSLGADQSVWRSGTRARLSALDHRPRRRIRCRPLARASTTVPPRTGERDSRRELVRERLLGPRAVQAGTDCQQYPEQPPAGRSGPSIGASAAHPPRRQRARQLGAGASIGDSDV